jgi:hypothetical protein
MPEGHVNKTASNLRLALLAAAACLALAGTAAAQAPGWPALEHDYIAFTHIQDPVRARAAPTTAPPHSPPKRRRWRPSRRGSPPFPPPR